MNFFPITAKSSIVVAILRSLHLKGVLVGNNKQRSKSRHSGRWIFALGILLFLGFGNWFVHLPLSERVSFGKFQPLLEEIGVLSAGATDTIGLTGQDVSIPMPTVLQRGPLPFGIPRVTDASRAPNDCIILKRKGYWVGYSPRLGHPIWAAYAIPTKKILTFLPERPSRFEQDRQVPKSPTHEDYSGSGYDRGHMAPNYVIATRYGKVAQRETFLMTNISPQRPNLNRGPWKVLEKTIADDLSAIGDTIWVITGTVPARVSTKLPRTHIEIPQGFYKVIASLHKGQLRVIGAYLPQTVSPKARPRFFLRSIDTLETLSGLDFFPDLSQAQQVKLEKEEATRFWPRWELF
ncbi:MAG: DNA/RNA non-specific endonuclease [Kiritimatiellia bacterium]